jgi:ketosteroid isomerase-like protein
MTLATEQNEWSRTRSEPSSLHDDELEVHQRISTLAAAIRNKNVDQVLSHYSPEVVAYDMLPPLEVHGIAAYRHNLETWFASMSGRINYQMMDLHISAGDEFAFCHCLSHVTGARTGGGRADYWVRVSSGWRKVNGEWLVAHEHVSMPTMM